jgi:hypothetical protein
MKMPKGITLALAGLLAACTTQELYVVGQGWQQQECRKLPDLAERSRCEKSAATSYERYQADAEATKKPRP